jgi:hypothetical protein
MALMTDQTNLIPEAEVLLPELPKEAPVVDLDNPEAVAKATPEEIEAQLVKEQIPEDPMAGIAQMIAGYKTPFVNLVDGLSSKSLKRLLKALVLLPLEDFVPNMKRKEEKTAFLVGEKLLHAKLTMIHYTALEEQARQAADRERILAENAAKENNTTEVSTVEASTNSEKGE